MKKEKLFLFGAFSTGARFIYMFDPPPEPSGGASGEAEDGNNEAESEPVASEPDTSAQNVTPDSAKRAGARVTEGGGAAVARLERKLWHANAKLKEQKEKDPERINARADAWIKLGQRLEEEIGLLGSIVSSFGSENNSLVSVYNRIQGSSEDEDTGERRQKMSEQRWFLSDDSFRSAVDQVAMQANHVGLGVIWSRVAHDDRLLETALLDRIREETKNPGYREKSNDIAVAYIKITAGKFPKNDVIQKLASTKISAIRKLADFKDIAERTQQLSDFDSRYQTELKKNRKLEGPAVASGELGPNEEGPRLPTAAEARASGVQVAERSSGERAPEGGEELSDEQKVSRMREMIKKGALNGKVTRAGFKAVFGEDLYDDNRISHIVAAVSKKQGELNAGGGRLKKDGRLGPRTYAALPADAVALLNKSDPDIVASRPNEGSRVVLTNFNRTVWEKEKKYNANVEPKDARPGNILVFKDGGEVELTGGGAINIPKGTPLEITTIRPENSTEALRFDLVTADGQNILLSVDKVGKASAKDVARFANAKYAGARRLRETAKEYDTDRLTRQVILTDDLRISSGISIPKGTKVTVTERPSRYDVSVASGNVTKEYRIEKKDMPVLPAEYVKFGDQKVFAKVKPGTNINVVGYASDLKFMERRIGGSGVVAVLYKEGADSYRIQTPDGLIGIIPKAALVGEIVAKSKGETMAQVIARLDSAGPAPAAAVATAPAAAPAAAPPAPPKAAAGPFAQADDNENPLAQT